MWSETLALTRGERDIGKFMTLDYECFLIKS